MEFAWSENFDETFEENAMTFFHPLQHRELDKT